MIPTNQITLVVMAQMINKFLLSVAVACALSVQSPAQEAATQPPDVAVANEQLPPEPDKGLKRKIWEGYYNALLNRNYHLERSVIMEKASEEHAKYGRLVAVVSFTIPFMILVLHLQHALKQKTDAKKLVASLGPTVCTIIVIGLAGFGIWYGLESSLNGSAEQDRAQAHKELYQDWKSLAVQWQDVHDLSLKRQPNDILQPQYKRLNELAEAISARETPDLYDAELHREVQARLDEYLVKDAEHAKA
jgi:hypothetical protein